MDNFIDKLAQKFTAGEVIRANQAAEEQELKRLRLQVSEYEKCLQEMRKLQLRNTETAESIKALTRQSEEDLQRLSKESLEKITQIAAESGGSRVEAELSKLFKQQEENQKAIEEWFKQADDFLHKENVKVYRNVQAVIVEECKAKSEMVLAAQEATAEKYYKKSRWMLVLTLLAAAAGVIIQILDICGVF
ncbi:MAG: hypothetical protein ACI4VG_08920 [Lachnospiraceae bacterium]